MTTEHKEEMNRSDVDATVRQYVTLAARGLAQMFLQDRGLFCYSFDNTNGGMVPVGESYRYTMMTLMGFDRLERGGTPAPMTSRPILDRLFADLTWVDNIGDLGLLLWMCGETAPDRLRDLDRRLALSTALDRFEDAKKGCSMELAWFLTGLSHWALLDANQPQHLRDLAVKTQRTLIANQGAGGFFAHFAPNRSLAGRIRGWVGSFADQVYPIIALSKFARAFGDDAALRQALTCARGICNTQGPLGQWCWHYDSTGDRVMEGYPVFSVHQHAMAPMALFQLEEVSGENFDQWIYKGLEWIKQNELGVDMEDATAGVIWRCIGRPRAKRCWDLLRGRRIQPAKSGTPMDFRVLKVCRPYELGWLLYAFGGGVGRQHRHPETRSTVSGCV